MTHENDFTTADFVILKIVNNNNNDNNNNTNKYHIIFTKIFFFLKNVLPTQTSDLAIYLVIYVDIFSMSTQITRVEYIPFDLKINLVQFNTMIFIFW